MIKLLATVILAFTLVFAYENSDDFINEINSKQNLWKAGRNFPANTPISAIRRILGSKRVPKEIIEKIPVVSHEISKYEEIPESFDSRENWSQCTNLKYVPDQSNCASCWAVSVTSAISDRICIHSDSKLQPSISARNAIACSIGHGCGGGHEILAWGYWQGYGFVTGGPYGSNVGCQPYLFPECDINPQGSKPACNDIGPFNTPECVRRCDNSSLNYEDELFFGDQVYFVGSNETQIQIEIMKNGPVTASFDMYADFLYYKSGVYVQTSDYKLGGHAVRLIGWGVENSTKYWLGVNSFNEDWGDKGLFKIRRGTNECTIESQVNAGLPKQK